MDNKKFILHRTVYDWLLEAIAFLGMASTVIPACYMGKSANPIPVHFNFRGEPDAWGNASELEYLAIIGIILYILLTAVEFVYPIFNSLTGSTEKNALLVKRAQIRLIRHLKALTTLMTANLAVSSLLITAGKTSTLAPYALPLSMALLTGLLIYYILKINRLHNKT